MVDSERYGSGRPESGDITGEYERQYRPLVTYCALVLGDRDAAADIVQESYYRLVRQVKMAQPPSDIRGWLFICARNLCFTELRRRKSSRIDANQLWRPPEQLDPESARFVEQVLARLSPEERDLILMREQQRYAIGEMAAMLEISEEAVRVRLFRVRKRMQELGRT
jgi:RNA polymerase sigma-70 factor, ECF subfamily